MRRSAEPSPELAMVRTRLDRMYDEWLDGRAPAWTPAIDIVRAGGHLVLRADLPGVKPDAVWIDIQDGILTLFGDTEAPNDRADARYLRRERRAGSFCRSMVLPTGAEAERVTATTHDGVVEVTIPLAVAATREKPGRLSP